MKLSVEERQIMVSLEYEKAQSFLEQAEKIAAMDLWDVVANRLYSIQYSMRCQPF